MTGLRTVFFFVIFLSVSSLFTLSKAQKRSGNRVSGLVLDAKSEETLPAANILIKDTYRGTITNANGAFDLEIPGFPTTIVVRYIGYKTQEIDLASPNQHLVIRLEVVELELPEIVVSGEDPALSIMREVIKRKQEWRQRLKTYKADAYTRQIVESDTTIASITETISKVFWDREKGSREVITAKNQTENIQANQNFAASIFTPNFYNDNLDVLNFKMVGPTHPNALSFYNFELVGHTYIDNKLVYIIEISPKRKLQPLFVGTIRVMADEYALLDVDLIPSDAIIFPPPIRGWNLHYKQQFNNFGGDFWLPVDARIEGTIKIGIIGLNFPEIKFSQLSRISDYEINVALPDTLYKKTNVLSVDSVAISDSLLIKAPKPIPLSIRETQAFKEIDSTQTMDKAFKPSGALARFVNADEDEEHKSKKNAGSIEKALSAFSNYFTPLADYNRVDELMVGLKFDRRFKRFEPQGRAEYHSNTEKWGYGLGLRYRWGKSPRNGKTFIEAGYREYSAQTYGSTNYDPLLNGVAVLLGNQDYFDYFWKKRTYLAISSRIREWDSVVELQVISEEHRNINIAPSSYDFFGINNRQRVNPLVDEGRLNALELKWEIGDDYVPYGIIGQRNAEFSIEHSDSWLDSEFSFTRVSGRIDYRFPTFYQRRFLPNAFDVRLEFSSKRGDDVPSHLVAIDSQLGTFAPFGSLKTLTEGPLIGEHTLGFFWEHNFRTIPFEALGWMGVARRGISLIVFGGHAKAWGHSSPFPTGDEDYGVHEIGVGLSGFLDLLRGDISFRLDEPAVIFTISTARIF